MGPWGLSHLESTGTRGAQMMTILEEVQDQGGEEEAPKPEKYDLSQQNLPLATPLPACEMGVGLY